MRRPPIKIRCTAIAGEIIKAGEVSKVFTMPIFAELTGDELAMAVRLKVNDDRLSLTDATFRKKYVNYIKRQS